MKEYYDVIVIGSGPGGMGTCFKLSENSKRSILMIEKNTYSNGGFLNDNKQNFSAPIGFDDLWSRELAEEYIKKSEKYLKPNFIPLLDISMYMERAKKFNTELFPIRQSHVGTDKSKAYVNELMSQLKNNGVEVLLNTEVVDIDYQNKKIILKSGESIGFGNLVLAVGRSGANWLQEIMDKLGIEYVDNKIDLGIRIECKASNYQITKKFYDPKFWLPENCRTFCTNSAHGASVVKERYDGYFSVNGHALSDDKPDNGLVNFSLLKSITLTEPLASGTKYAQILGKACMAIANGKPIMQRIGDIRLGKRSKAETFNQDLYDFQPTLKSCTPGDITLAMPAKIWNSLWKSIKILDSIVPDGIMRSSTILYYPEIKLYANKPKFIDEYFQVKDNIYMHSDGAGTSRGIVGAFCSGLRCADGILLK